MISPLGLGISVRRSFLGELSRRLSEGDDSLCSQLSWVEIVPENFMGRSGNSRRALLEVAERVSVALHGVSLSVGGSDPLSSDYLSQLGSLARDTRARWVTDHLCFSSHGGAQFQNLLPLPFTREAVRHVVNRVKEVQSYLGIPFGLENPSYYLEMPGAEMTEAQFFSEILEQSDCQMLLDINNVYVNCYNHIQTDGNRVQAALEASRNFLRQLPLERMIEVHVAGHEERFLDEAESKPMLLDSHGAPVSDPVRGLLQELQELRPIKTLLLERESNVPTLDEIVGEAVGLWNGLKRKPVRTFTEGPGLSL